MLKNRNTAAEKKDAILKFRTRKALANSLAEFANNSGKSRTQVMEEALKTHITAHSRQLPCKRAGEEVEDYFCDSCNSQIKISQKYYTEIANLEKFVESEKNPKVLEIEVSDSIPTKILCLKCAKKKKKLEQFKTPKGKTNNVESSKRTLP